MKKYLLSSLLLIVITAIIPLSVCAKSNYYCNGTDTIQIGNVQYFSNNEDEDKLYSYDLTSNTECKMCDEHIISLLKNSEEIIYFISYDNGDTKLKQLNEEGNTIELIEFNEIINSFAIRNNIIYIVKNNGIYQYDLECKNLSAFIPLKNIAFIYFSDSDTLKYYVEDENMKYQENEYNFELQDDNKNLQAHLFDNDLIELMSSSSYTSRLSAPATDNPYYTSLNVFHTSGYGMVGNGGNCTCYAYGRSYENLGYAPSLSTSNAENWYNYNINNGYYGYGKTPYLGAVAVWGKGIIGNSSDGAGHVAVVEVIDGDTVTTSESGWNSFYFKTVSRSASNSNFSASSSYTFQGFIYVMGQISNSQYESKPSNVSIASDKTEYTLGETAKLSYTIDHAWNWAAIVLYYDGEDHFVTINGSPGTIDYKFPKAGWYYVYTKGTNSAGTSDCNGIWIEVKGIAPTNVTIDSNAKNFQVGETCDLYYTIEGAIDEYIVVYYDGEDHLIKISGTSGTAHFTFPHEGNYYIYTKGSNNVGVTDCYGVWITAYSSLNLGDDFVGYITNNYSGTGYDIIEDSSHNVVIYSHTEDENHKWHFVKQSDGSYEITNMSTGRCLDVRDSGTTKGTNVWTYYDNDTSAQRWYIRGNDGSYVLKSACNTNVCDITDAIYYNGTNIQMCDDHGDPAQKFAITKISPYNISFTASTTTLTNDENITFTYNMKAANNANIIINKDGHIYDSLLTTSVNGSTNYMFNDAGTYSCYIIGHNLAGDTNSQKITINVTSKTYSIKYDANGGNGAPSVQIKNKNQTCYLSSIEPVRDGYKFMGWSYNKNEGNVNYIANEPFEENYDIILYAVWQRNTYKIMYNINGGIGDVVQDVCDINSNAIITDINPIREGYKFLGWGKSLEDKVPSYVVGDVYYGRDDITLYAIWEIIPSTETTIVKKSSYSLINVSVKNADVGNIVVVAIYENDRLVDCQLEKYNGEDVSIATFNQYDTIKIMLWEGLDSLKPLCKSEIK